MTVSRLMPRLLAMFIVGLSLLSSPPAAGTEQLTYAVLIGNGVYQGISALPNLKYTDVDVLRVATLLRPLVPPENFTLLLEPTEQTAAQLNGQGLKTWSPPTVANVLSQLTNLQISLRKVRRERGNTVQVSVIFYISAHGDQSGIHLKDDKLPGANLTRQLDALEADSVLLVADACDSADMVTLKGEVDANKVSESPPPVDLAVLEREMGGLEKLGRVAARTATVEDVGLIRGGVMTYLTVTALRGAADLSQNGKIEYHELKAYLDAYTGSGSQRYRPVLVLAPHSSRELPPVAFDLTLLPQQGLTFPPEPGRRTVGYWVLDSSGRLVGEVWKRGKDPRKLYLPAGHYEVITFNTPADSGGFSGRLEVGTGWTRVRLGDLKLPRVRPTKGSEGTVASPGTDTSEAPLSPEQVAYLDGSSRRPLTWRYLSDGHPWALRLASSRALLGHEGWLSSSAYHRSLTQERPTVQATLIADRRIARLPPGYLTLGADVGLGASFKNQVGYVPSVDSQPATASSTSDVTVFSVRYRTRIGYEARWGAWTGRAVVAIGGLHARPLGAKPGPASPSEEQSVPSLPECQAACTIEDESCQQACVAAELGKYVMNLGGAAGLELSASRPLTDELSFELGLGSELTVEAQDVEEGPLVPYLGGLTWAGIRW